MSSIILRVEDTKENQIEAPFQKKKNAVRFYIRVENGRQKSKLCW